MLDSASTPAGGSPYSTDSVRRQIWPKSSAVKGRPLSKRYSHFLAIPPPWALVLQTGACVPFWLATAPDLDNVKCVSSRDTGGNDIDLVITVEETFQSTA